MEDKEKELTGEDVDRLDSLVNGDPEGAPAEDGPKMTKADFEAFIGTDEGKASLREALGIGPEDRMSKADRDVRDELDALSDTASAERDSGGGSVWMDADQMLKALERQHDDIVRLRDDNDRISRENAELRGSLSSVPDLLKAMDAKLDAIGKVEAGSARLIKAMSEQPMPGAAALHGSYWPEPVGDGGGLKMTRDEAGRLLIKAKGEAEKSGDQARAALIGSVMTSLDGAIAVNGLLPAHQDLIRELKEAG